MIEIVLAILIALLVIPPLAFAYLILMGRIFSWIVEILP